MKTFFPMILSVCLIGTALAESIGTEQELKRLETEAWNAVVKLDFKTIDRILADEFIGIYDNDDEANDPIWTKEFVISAVKSGKYVLTSIKYDDLKVRVDDNSAAVSGVATTKETFDGQDMSGRFRFTSTWIKKPTGWQCTGDHAVRIADSDTKDSDKQQLIELYRIWLNASLKNDVATIDGLLTNDFTCGLEDGNVLTKTQLLADMRSGDYQTSSIRDDDRKIRVYGDMAIVNLIWTEKSQYKGMDTSGQYFSTDTWIKRNGRWQCVAVHISKMAKTTDDAPKPSPELRKLEGIVGKWEYEGEQVDPPVASLPFGSAGKFSGTFTNRFILGGLFLESKSQDKNPSGTTGGLSITGYDVKTKNYIVNSFLSDGSRETSVESISPDGRIWTSNSTMTTSNGKKVLIKSVVKYSSDWSSSSGTTEVSPDDGKTWKFWYKSEARKVNK